MVVAEDYEIVCQKRDSQSSHYKNGEPVGNSKNSLWWAQIRVLHRKRLGVASTVFCDGPELRSMVDRAFELADNTAVDPWFRFPLWKADGSSSGKKESEFQDALGFEPRFFESLYPQLTVHPVGLEEKYLEQNDSRRIVRKTEKLVRAFSVCSQKLSFGVVNECPSGFYSIEEFRGFSSPLTEKETFLETMLRRSNRLTRAKALNSAPHGKYILNGVVVAALLKNIENFFNGSLVALGKSKLLNQIENQIFSDVVTIVDNGLYPGGEGFQEYDFEGAQSQETKIVENGVLKTFLHDASTAARYNRVSTANLVFHETISPSIGVTNCYLSPSESSLFDLFKEMGDGVYLESLEKLSKGLTRDGKLELLGHGWRVQGGEPVEPITHLFLKLDPLEIFKEINAVGNDLEFWGRYGAPSVFLEKMPLRDV